MLVDHNRVCRNVYIGSLLMVLSTILITAPIQCSLSKRNKSRIGELENQVEVLQLQLMEQQGQITENKLDADAKSRER